MTEEEKRFDEVRKWNERGMEAFKHRFEEFEGYTKEYNHPHGFWWDDIILSGGSIWIGMVRLNEEPIPEDFDRYEFLKEFAEKKIEERKRIEDKG